MQRQKLPQPAIWFPTIRAGSGTDIFTERLAEGLRHHSIQAEITWLPLRAEYAPWTVPIPKPPAWANVVHINSWLHPRFVPKKLPTVVTVHHSVHDPASMPYKTLMQKLYHRFWIRQIEACNLKFASAVTAVSRHVATQIERWFGRSNVLIIPNGIDVEHTFTPGAEREPYNPFRLLYVGNWIVRKGVDLLPSIFERLGPNFELLYTADRGGAHAKYPLPPNSRCIGRLDPPSLAQAYRDADALIFPSRSEGLPLTAIEAMACGLPVVASSIPSLAEVIQHGVTGFLCPMDQFKAFVETIIRLREDKSIWQEMRQAARRHAERYFSLERQIQSYLRCYGKILTQTHI